MYDAKEAKRILEYRKNPFSDGAPFNIRRRYEAIRYYQQHIHEGLMKDFYKRFNEHLLSSDPNESFEPSFIIYPVDHSIFKVNHGTKILDILGLYDYESLIKHAHDAIFKGKPRNLHFYTEPHDDMRAMKATLFARPTIYFLVKPFIQELTDKGYILSSISFEPYKHYFYMYFKIRLPEDTEKE